MPVSVECFEVAHKAWSSGWDGGYYTAIVVMAGIMLLTTFIWRR